MKLTNTLFIIGALMSAMALSANPRSIEEARLIGTELFRASNPNAVLTSASEVLSRSESPKYYVFNVDDNAGYVIVSSDDRFQDILGYSDHGSYDLMLENPSFQFWLAAMSAEMASNPVSLSIDTPSYKAKAPDIAPLMKTKWGQGAPYNNECWESGPLRPEIGWKPQHAPTGCVATAMAQVMYYHQWPQVYHYGNISYEFNWDIMEPSYTGNESEESIDQVAHLMKYCGNAVNMKYAVNESGASTFAIPRGMVNYFGYDGSTIRKIWRDSYTYDVLHDMLFTELKEGRPIIVGGEYPEVAGGHQFVIDGCNSDDFFHVNWGWEGYCDGYFRLTSMRPADFSTGGREQGYSFNMDFTIGIQPKRNITEDVMHGVLTPMGDLQLYDKADEETVTVKYKQYNSSYAHYYVPVTTVNGEYPGFMNTGAGDFRKYGIDYQDAVVTKLVNTLTGEVTLCDDADYDALDMKTGYYTNAVSMYYTTPDFDLKEGVQYKASLCYKLYDDDNLHELTFGPGRRSYLILERSGDNLKITQPRTESIDVLAEFPSDMNRIVRRDPQNFSVKVTNNSATEYLGGVKWRFKDAQGNFCDDMSDYIMVNVRPGESITDDFTLFNITKGTPGKYKVGLYDYRGRLISSERDVELYDFALTIDASNFPDSDFRQYVSSAFDHDRNGTLSDSELEAIREIKMDGNQATDLTGVGYFYNLDSFILNNGNLRHLDLSDCPEIYQISVISTPLETISLSGNPELGYIEIKKTLIKDLDLSDCPEATHVLVDDNEIESLTFHSSTPLYQLSCSRNKISSLDLSGQKDLKYLSCSDNALTSINISGLRNIVSLTCSNNSLTALDVSALNNLTYLSASSNAISDFKMASHPELKNLNIDENNISGKIDLSGAPAIESIEVRYNSISEIVLGNHPNLKYLRIGRNSISGDIDLSGYENLVHIWAEENKLSSVKLGKHPSLTQIYVNDNNLEGELDMSGCPKIEYIFANNNSLNKVALTQHPELTYLNMGFNGAEGVLDISGAEKLMQLWASDNKISELRYNQHPNLQRAILSNNCLTHFNADDFPNLNGTYSCYGQEANISITTPNFNSKTLATTKFDHNRASEWWASWFGEDGQRQWYECSVISGVVMIPDEAGRYVDLTYRYLTDVATNTTNNFTIHLTREGFNGIEDVSGDEAFTISDGKICFNEYVSGEIYTATGILMYSGSGDSGRLPGGIYVVRVGTKTATVAIP